MHTAEIKVLVEPELKSQVNQARGLVSLSAWVRDAIEMKLIEIRMLASTEKVIKERDKFSKREDLPPWQLP